MSTFEQWLDEQGTVWKAEEELARKAWNAAIEAAAQVCCDRSKRWEELKNWPEAMEAEDCAIFIIKLKEK